MEIVRQTIQLQVGKTRVAIILLTRETTTLMINGVRQPILRHGVTCLLLRAEVVMRTTTQAGLVDKTAVDGTEMEATELEEIMVGEEIQASEQTPCYLQEVGVMAVPVQLEDRRAIVQAGEALDFSHCLHMDAFRYYGGDR